jgi:undecaprenyl-diphosphatase
VKIVIDRPRPSPDLVHVVQELHSYSFPSGHVTGYVCLFGFLFYLAYTLLPHTDRRRLPLLVGMALPVVLIGVSRVYMGQHWASDALAGYALGFAYLLIVIEAYRAWLRRTNTKTAAVPAKDQGPGTRP